MIFWYHVGILFFKRKIHFLALALVFTQGSCLIWLLLWWLKNGGFLFLSSLSTFIGGHFTVKMTFSAATTTTITLLLSLLCLQQQRWKALYLLCWKKYKENKVDNIEVNVSEYMMTLIRTSSNSPKRMTISVAWN